MDPSRFGRAFRLALSHSRRVTVQSRRGTDAAFYRLRDGRSSEDLAQPRRCRESRTRHRRQLGEAVQQGNGLGLALDPKTKEAAVVTQKPPGTGSPAWSIRPRLAAFADMGRLGASQTVQWAGPSARVSCPKGRP